MTVTPLHPGRRTAAPMTLSEALAQVEVTYVPPPSGMPEDAPRVFAVVSAVMRDTVPVGKDQVNAQQRYKFRGIDDVMSAMAGPMRAHGLFILPRLAEYRAERRGEDGRMTHVVITMRYHVYGPAGDCLVADVPGEASDYADKATNKAQSAALKYLLFTLFMIPVDGRSIDDGDREHPVEPTPEQRAEQAHRQRRQQPRRSNRAEPGPWEQPARPAARRDYLAEAEQATSREAFGTIRAAAVRAGAPTGYLDRLDAVARHKEQTPNQPQRQRDPEPGNQTPAGPASQSAPDAVAAEDAVPAQAGAERAAVAAEERLRLTASRAGLQTLDADFERAYGAPIGQAPAHQLTAFADMIEKAAQ
ncbi:ERF family protein [Streptomyces sp. NPDC048558]|uniref:ERF family protein n=1 Tax=Streptomyces sp. NPDC048558 TaxID=3155759 RepID=UPI003416FBCF